MWRRFLAPGLLILAIFVAYGDIYNFAFLYDDEFLIIKNQFLESFSNLGRIFSSSSTAGAGGTDSFFRPMQIVAYLAINQIFGREAWAFHLLNLSLHACNALLIFLLGRKLRISQAVAAAVALVWAVHPLHTEAVTYMSATADTLHVLFLLLGIYTSLFVQRPVGVILGIVLFGLALLSKESAIVFPALLTVMTFYLSKDDRWSWRQYLATIPFWAIAAGYFLLRRTWLNLNDDFAMYKTANVYSESILNRTFTFLATLPSYVQLILWPTGLHMDRQFSVYTDLFLGPVLWGLVIVIGVIAFGVLSRAIAFIGLWFIAAHIPHAGILIPANALFLEHWMYLPTIGAVLMLGHGVDQFRPNLKNWAVIGLLMVALALGLQTHRQNRVWESAISFFSNTLAHNPGSDRTRHNLAMAFSDVGRNDEALEQYQIVVEHTDQYPQPFHNMGRIYLERGQYDKAEIYFKRAIAINPRFFQSYAALVELYQLKGDRVQASEYQKKYEALTRSF